MCTKSVSHTQRAFEIKNCNFTSSSNCSTQLTTDVTPCRWISRFSISSSGSCEYVVWWKYVKVSKKNSRLLLEYL